MILRIVVASKARQSPSRSGAPYFHRRHGRACPGHPRQATVPVDTMTSNDRTGSHQTTKLGPWPIRTLEVPTLFPYLTRIIAAWAALMPGQPGSLFDSPKPELGQGVGIGARAS